MPDTAEATRRKRLDPQRAMAILAAMPTDRFVRVTEVNLPVTEATARAYCWQMVKDGWLETESADRGVGKPGRRYRRIWELASYFEPRDFPQVMWFGDDALVGPFCANCGWHTAGHGGRLMRCPARVHPLLGGKNAA